MAVVIRLIFSFVIGWIVAAILIFFALMSRSRLALDKKAMDNLALGAVFVGLCVAAMCFWMVRRVGIQKISPEEAENGFDVKLSLAYVAFITLIGTVSLGILAIPFWIVSRRLPKRVDREGMTLRNGRLLRWQDVTSITKGVKTMGGTPIGVWYDMKTAADQASIVVNNLANGRAVLAFCSRQLGQTLTADV